jgi:purine-binding chemotaxis protein CheW
MANETTILPGENMATEDDSLGTDSETRQFVTFMSGNEVFAVDMAPVQEIIRIPQMVRVPLAPPALEGLSNLRGKVLPIVSLRRIFGFEEREPDDASRAVVIDMGQPLGFVVDKVSSVLGVEPGQIESVGSIRATVNTDLLAGLIKDVGGHAMIMVLDFKKLIAQEFADLASLTKAVDMAVHSSDPQAEAEEAITDELQMVSFEVADQEYAIAIEDVQEIVQIPETIIHVPHSDPHVLGVMTLRNRLLPLVSLRRMFALPERAVDDHCRIVVVSLGSTSVGVVMDRVNEVLRVPRSVVDSVPPMLARDGDLADISDICRIDGGKRLVSIISARNLFRHSAIKEALNTVDTLRKDEERELAAGAEDEKTDDDEQVVVGNRSGPGRTDPCAQGPPLRGRGYQPAGYRASGHRPAQAAGAPRRGPVRPAEDHGVPDREPPHRLHRGFGGGGAANSQVLHRVLAEPVRGADPTAGAHGES